MNLANGPITFKTTAVEGIDKQASLTGRLLASPIFKFDFRTM